MHYISLSDCSSSAAWGFYFLSFIENSAYKRCHCSDRQVWIKGGNFNIELNKVKKKNPAIFQQMAQQVFCICWTGKAIRQDLLCKRTSLSLLSPQLSPWLNAFTLSKQFRREIQCGVCMHIFAEWKNYQGWDKSVSSKLCEWVLFFF